MNSDTSFFEAFFERCPIGLNLCRLDGRYLKSNPAYLSIIGYTAAEVDNDNFSYWKVTPPEYASAEQKQLESLSEKGSYGPYSKEYLRKDGKRVPVRLNGFLIEVENEKYIWSMIEDLSTQANLHKKLERSEYFYRALLDQLPIAVFVKDSQKDWSFSLWNKIAEETLGLKKEEVLGKNDYDLFPKEESDHFRQKDMEALRSKDRIEIEQESLSSPGQPQKWLQTAKVSMNDAHGKPRYLVGISQDISKRKEFEDKLRIATQESHKASLAKSEFLSNMSHEIRNPLHAMLGVTELLADTPMDATQRKYLQTLLSAGSRLLEIVNDILDLERIEAGHLTVHQRSEDLFALVTGVADLMVVPAQRANLELARNIQLRENFRVTTDAGILHQILNNIIGNAIKFTPTGGRVELKATWEKGTLTVTVRDTGIGIAKEKLSKIFEPFEQGDSSVRKRYGGTGLGLAIVQRLVKKLDGTVSLRSELNLGTIVTVHIPMTEGEPADAHTDPDPELFTQSALPSGPATILFADDSLDNRELIREILRDQPFTLVAASDGAEALKAFEESRPDVLILDIGMPVLDGNETIRRIRQREKELGLRPTPAVALTGYALSDDRDRAFASGFDMHLPKPFKPSQLRAMIRECCRRTPRKSD